MFNFADCPLTTIASQTHQHHNQYFHVLWLFYVFFLFLKTHFLVLTLKISIFKTQSAFQGNWIVKKSCTGKWIFYSCCLNSAYFVLTRIFNEKEQFANCWNAAVLHLTRPRSIVGKEGFLYWSGRWSFIYGLFQPPVFQQISLI